MTRTGVWVYVLGMLCLVSTVHLNAQEEASEAFVKGSRYSLLDAEFYTAVHEGRRSTTFNMNAGVGKYLWNRVGLYGIATFLRNSGYTLEEISPSLEQMDADAYGLSFSGLLRWHALQWDRCSLFIDGSAGGIYSDKPFPPNGTQWNYVLRSGAGLTYDLGKKIHLTAGYRFMHISNGRRVGDRNPAYDSHCGFLGIIFQN